MFSGKHPVSSDLYPIVSNVYRTNLTYTTFLQRNCVFPLVCVSHLYGMSYDLSAITFFMHCNFELKPTWYMSSFIMYQETNFQLNPMKDIAFFVGFWVHEKCWRISCKFQLEKRYHLSIIVNNRVTNWCEMHRISVILPLQYWI